VITLLRAAERVTVQRHKQVVLITFPTPVAPETAQSGYGTLLSFDEHHVPPACGVSRHSSDEAEILTWMMSGTLAQDDTSGRSGVVDAGEWQLMRMARGLQHHERNASQSEWARFVRLSLRPPMARAPFSAAQVRVTLADRRRGWYLIASPDGRRGSLVLGQSVTVWAVALGSGQHVLHAIEAGRAAWLHVVRGSAELGDLLVCTGDSVGVSEAPAVSLLAREDTEVLLVDLPAPAQVLAMSEATG
jgi:redox-sensitive bicupin YhaK (pirin superfamily)